MINLEFKELTLGLKIYDEFGYENIITALKMPNDGYYLVELNNTSIFEYEYIINNYTLLQEGLQDEFKIDMSQSILIRRCKNKLNIFISNGKTNSYVIMNSKTAKKLTKLLNERVLELDQG